MGQLRADLHHRALGSPELSLSVDYIGVIEGPCLEAYKAFCEGIRTGSYGIGSFLKGLLGLN